MENTSKEFFAPTLTSGLSQSLNFGRVHMFPLFQPAIQALTSKQPCNICKVLLASQMRKNHPKVTASRNQFLLITGWPASPPSSLPPLILFFITSMASNIWHQQVIDYLGRRVARLTEQNGSHLVAVFNSSGSRRTTSSHKHKHVWLFVQKRNKNQSLGRDTLMILFSRLSLLKGFNKHATFSPLHGGCHSF